MSEDTPENMIPPGTAYEDIYTFYGRIPGTVELRVWHTDPNLAPVNPGATDDGPRVYTLVIDEDFNVICRDDAEAP